MRRKQPDKPKPIGFRARFERWLDQENYGTRVREMMADSRQVRRAIILVWLRDEFDMSYGQCMVQSVVDAIHFSARVVRPYK